MSDRTSLISELILRPFQECLRKMLTATWEALAVRQYPECGPHSNSHINTPDSTSGIIWHMAKSLNTLPRVWCCGGQMKGLFYPLQLSSTFFRQLFYKSVNNFLSYNMFQSDASVQMTLIYDLKKMHNGTGTVMTQWHGMTQHNTLYLASICTLRSLK